MGVIFHTLILEDVAFPGGVLALKTALLPERRLYREIFSMRIKALVIELRPCLAWDWSFNLPSLSPEWTPSWESLAFLEEGYYPMIERAPALS